MGVEWTGGDGRGEEWLFLIIIKLKI